MTPEEVSAYYDEPDNTAAMCDLLMRTYPGWEVWRQTDTRIWTARSKSWPEDRPALTYVNAGLLNEAIHALEAGDPG
ncbi:hypothetical protein ACIBHX_02235 [Nonomuraea sp. NPDC050536]|uniref:hypothetical protein n=1 Tax=Nonomuraea sp. NPDC050536 TaxID=3364366 RepID=UPI0037CCB2E9